MRKRRGCLSAAAVCLVLTAVLIGGIAYRTSWAKTEVVTSSSDDGRYTLIVYMIGEPEWPFGSTHCRFDLMEGPRRIVKYPFSVQDDGAAAHEGNFRIVWYADSVRITASGSEQEDREYVLRFDGRAEQTE